MKPKHLMAVGVLLVVVAVGVIGLRDGKDHLTATATGGGDPAANQRSKTARAARPEAERT